MGGKISGGLFKRAYLRAMLHPRCPRAALKRKKKLFPRFGCFHDTGVSPVGRDVGFRSSLSFSHVAWHKPRCSTARVTADAKNCYNAEEVRQRQFTPVVSGRGEERCRTQYGQFTLPAKRPTARYILYRSQDVSKVSVGLLSGPRTR